VFGSAVAGGRVRATASHLRPNQLVYKNGCPLSRLRHIKNYFLRRDASPLTRSASKPMGKILGGGKILPPLLKERTKNQKISVAEKILTF